MTLRPEQLGDQGQRYQIEAEGYPADGWQVVGWANDYGAAVRLANGIYTAPSCTLTAIRDRHDCAHTFEYDDVAAGTFCKTCGIVAPIDYGVESGLDAGTGEPC